MCGHVQPNYGAVLYIVLHPASRFGDMLLFSHCCSNIFEAF